MGGFIFFTLILVSCDGFLTPISSQSNGLPSSETHSTTVGSSMPSLESNATSIASSVPLTSEEVDQLFSLVEFNIDYVTEDYALPQPETLQSMLFWDSPNGVIEEGILRYTNPIKDTSIDLFATITFEGRSYQQAYEVIMKSQLQPPAVDKKAHLQLTLDNQASEADIAYEYTLNGTSTLLYDQHGTMQTSEITSPFTIRTRGHSTRFMPKRSYRLRFDKNTSLLGMKSAKNYILLANYIDHSQVRNAVVHYMSRFYDSLYAIDYRFIDLSIGGAYLGNYLLTERVEFHPNRLDVDFIPDAPNFDSGSLVELDYPGVEVSGEGTDGVDTFRVEGRPYAMKEPNLDTPGYQSNHFGYIRDYMQTVATRLRARQSVDDLIDIDNWVDYFLLQEITKNVDVGWGSVYLVKQTGEPLRHLPLWDFDISMGLGNYFDSGPQGHWGWADFNKNDFFTWMMQYPTIKSLFKTRLADFQARVLPEVIGYLETNASTFAQLFVANQTLWPLNVCEGGFCPIVSELMNNTVYQDHLDFLTSFLTTRTTWMRQNIV